MECRFGKGGHGRHQSDSNIPIQMGLSMKVLFGVALRQMAGFVGSLLRLVDLDRAGSDCSMLSRRQKTLAVNIRCRGLKCALSLLIDSAAI